MQSDSPKRGYEIEPYNSEWPKKFKEIADMLSKAFESKVIAIEHVGSTSIPGADAKPLIDVLVVVDDLENLKAEKETIISLGYFLREKVLENHSILFEKFVDEEKTENIHVVEKSADLIGHFLNVRDYLREHPERLHEYSILKKRLKLEFPDNYQAYRAGKHDFLEETERLAKE